GFDFHQHVGLRERPHLDKGGGGKIAGEELAARAPDLGVLGDVDDEDRHLDQIVHRAAGRLDDALDAGKYLFRLFVLVVADHSAAAFERARHLAGDVQRVARAYGVRPQTGAGLGDIWDR